MREKEVIHKKDGKGNRKNKWIHSTAKLIVFSEQFFHRPSLPYNWIFLSIFFRISLIQIARCVINWSFHIIIIKSKQMARWENLANVLVGINA